MSCRIYQPLLRHLPRRPDCGTYLYAALFESGIVKIGATCNPSVRLQALQAKLRDRIVDVHLHDLPEGAHKHVHERMALARVSSIAKPFRGREFFSGISFVAAINALCDERPKVSTRAPEEQQEA